MKATTAGNHIIDEQDGALCRYRDVLRATCCIAKAPVDRYASDIDGVTQALHFFGEGRNVNEFSSSASPCQYGCRATEFRRELKAKE